MKPPRPKPHLFISPDRLKSGTAQKALCKSVIPNVRWVWTSEDTVTIADFLGKFGALCPECRAAYLALESSDKVLALYGGIDGNQFIDKREEVIFGN